MQLCWGLDHPRERSRFISDFYGAIVDHQTDTGLLLGFISQAQAFGRLEVDLNQPAGVRALWQDLESICLPAGAKFDCDWACLHEFNPHQPHPLDQYMAVVSSPNRNGDLGEPVSGWCSWYYYGQDISEAGLHEQLEWMADNKGRLPLDLFLIDDGYQQSIGDWQRDIQSFPDPLGRLASQIKARSFDAGIWMAPLITLGGSDLAKNNPDWVLRDSKGKAVNAGFGWGQFFYALDGSHPDFRRELKKWIERAVSDWGFNFLKLDFLYAGALLGKRYDNTKTGAMVLREILEQIRSVAGEKVTLIGCGCPLGSGVGLVDSMRISPDVSASWRGRYKGISLIVNRDPGFPSAWNAIRNTYFRAHQHGHWWLNDPDCLILRDDQTRLNEDEVRTLATMVSLCGGVVIDSDELSSLADHRAAMLARLIPPLNHRPEQPALFCPDRPPVLLHRFSGGAGAWTLAAVFNFDASAAEFVVESSLLGFDSEDELIGFNYWEQRVRMFQGESWNLGMIPAHGVGLWALRMPSDRAAWVGDSIHISQGQCISTWEIDRGVLRATVSSGRVGNERIWLRIPGEVVSVLVDRESTREYRQRDDILTFEIQLSTLNLIEVRWN
jgi:alpha-galactosidase